VGTGVCWISQCLHPVIWFTWDTPSWKWHAPTCLCWLQSLASSSLGPITSLHHFSGWSKKTYGMHVVSLGWGKLKGLHTSSCTNMAGGCHWGNIAWPTPEIPGPSKDQWSCSGRSAICTASGVNA
jgi:hypothetical protein